MSELSSFVTDELPIELYNICCHFNLFFGLFITDATGKHQSIFGLELMSNEHALFAICKLAHPFLILTFLFMIKIYHEHFR